MPVSLGDIGRGFGVGGADEGTRTALVDTEKLARANRNITAEVDDKVTDQLSGTFLYSYLVVLLVIGTAYLGYLLFMKPNMTGVWLDSNGRRWYLRHSRLNSKLSVRIDGDGLGYCSVSDNMVKIGTLIGVWNYNDQVVFLNGEVIERVR